MYPDNLLNAEYHTQKRESCCDCTRVTVQAGRTAHSSRIPTGIFRLRAFRLLNREKVTMLLGVFRQRAERGEPGQRESAKDRLKFLRDSKFIKSTDCLKISSCFQFHFGWRQCTWMLFHLDFFTQRACNNRYYMLLKFCDITSSFFRDSIPVSSYQIAET